MGIPSEVLRQIRLLIFDLDGTLADTKQDLALSVNAMRASLSLAPLAEEVISSYVGRGVTVLVSKALGDSFMPAEMSRAQEFFLDYYRPHMLDHTVLYPAVRPVLERLRDRQLSVLTNKPSGFSRAMLAGLGIATYFSWVYGGDSFETKKPDPVGVFRLMEEAGVPAREESPSRSRSAPTRPHRAPCRALSIAPTPVRNCRARRGTNRRLRQGW